MFIKDAIRGLKLADPSADMRIYISGDMLNSNCFDIDELIFNQSTGEIYFTIAGNHKFKELEGKE